MKANKKLLAEVFGDVAREMRRCPPSLREAIIHDLMDGQHLTYDEATRKLERFIETADWLREASESIGEA